MNDVAARPRGRKRPRLIMVIAGVCAVGLAMLAAVLPGTANAATQVCSNTYVTSGGTYYGGRCRLESRQRRPQYLAIRATPRTSGTITFSNIVRAWSSHGMHLGTLSYQIMATEAWGGGTGNSSVTIH